MTSKTRHIVKQGLFFSVGTFIGNILNLLFNFYLGRYLSVESFSLVALYLGIQYAVGIFFQALTFTVVQSVSVVPEESKDLESSKIVSSWGKSVLYLCVGFSILWLLLSSILAQFFKVDAIHLVYFTPIFTIGSVIFLNRGILLARFKFSNAAAVFLTESSVKLIAALIFVSLGFANFSYLAIPFSIIIAFIVSTFFVKRLITNRISSNDFDLLETKFPTQFYLFSLLLGLSTLTFLSIDVILAKSFFSAAEAGAYALIALSGKMMFLFSSLVGAMFIPYFSSKANTSKNGINLFRLFLLITFCIVVTGITFFLLLGNQFFTMFFGVKVFTALNIMPLYIISIGLFSISYAIVLYHHSRREYLFPIISSLSLIILIIGTLILHETLEQFVNILSIVSFSNFIFILISHLLIKNKSGLTEEKNEFLKLNNSIPSEGVKTVSVGIPAYNEEYNIGAIIEKVLEQKEKGFVIKKIIIVSDGSADRTAEIVKQYVDEKIVFVEGTKNRGLNYRHNQIMSLVDTDILVLLNADLFLGDSYVISRLVNPIMNGVADFSAQWAKPVKPQTFLESILCAGFYLKYYIYLRHRNGDNIYTCVGHMRALSQKVYSDIVFPLQSEGEDQYLYLACLAKNYRYKHVPDANCYFRLPSSWNDYLHYARRIFQTQRKHKNIIEEANVDRERYVPPKLLLEGLVYAVLKSPVQSILYVILHIGVQRWALNQSENHSETYKISESTKQLFTPK